MSQIHVLAGDTNSRYQVVVHAPTPVGNNAAGIPWATAIINAGYASTVMIEGSGAGQITTAEKTQVLAGTVMEATFMWDDTPSWTNTQRLADLSLRASQLITELQNRWASQLRYFGATQ